MQNVAKNKENQKLEYKFLTSKELPSGKRMEKVPSDEIEENTSIMLDYRD